MVLETPAGLPSFWSQQEGGSHPPTQLEERRLDFQAVMPELHMVWRPLVATSLGSRSATQTSIFSLGSEGNIISSGLNTIYKINYYQLNWNFL